MLALTIALMLAAPVVQDASSPVVIATPADPAPTPTPTPTPSPSPPSAGSQGDIVVTGRGRWEAPDPLAGANLQSFKATQAVDQAVVGPVARAYKKKVPGPFRRGIHNFLYNLREPVVFVNFVLQHKIGKAAETVGRFALNSTIGIVGLFDMAKRKPFRLPRRSNGFANTLGFYGVPNGPFLFLPIVGPTTVRDLLGGTVDRLVLPVTLGQGVTDPKFAIPAGVLGALDHRAEFDETLKTLHGGAADPYARSRDFYLQRRQAEIDQLHGRGRDRGDIGPMSDPPAGPIVLKPRTPPVSAEAPVVEPVLSPPPPAPAEPAVVPDGAMPPPPLSPAA